MTNFVVTESLSGENVDVIPPELTQVTILSEEVTVDIDTVELLVETLEPELVNVEVFVNETDVIEPQDVLMINTATGQSSASFNVLFSSVTLQASYYGGLVGSSWKINRWISGVKTVATQSNNPGVLNLASAWEARTSLSYT